MSSIAHFPVRIQTCAQSVPSMPSWMGEVAIIAHQLRRRGTLDAIEQRVQFARRRFGEYDLIDFVVVLIGYALSGEPTLQAFYDRLQPWAIPFMALFGRQLLPHRSTLSRFLAALDQPAVEALRTLFLESLLATPALSQTRGGLWDRQGADFLVFDVDGTRQAARQRALPQGADLPAAKGRMEQVCAPGYTGRKRGEVVRTRTTILQAHTHQWLGTYSGLGNGDYRGELLRATHTIGAYLGAQQMALSQGIVRLDGLYGTLAVVADLGGLGYIIRGKDYHLLKLPHVQASLAVPPDQQSSHAGYTLFECPEVPVGKRTTRLIVATHQALGTAAKIGVTRKGVVYELFLTSLPQGAFSAADVMDLYRHRGGFETVLADEDQEQDPDRWCSHCPWGQECWQLISQWMWNLRLELGHLLHPTDMRMTQFAPADQSPLPAPADQSPLPAPVCDLPPTLTYTAPQWAQAQRPEGIGGQDFRLQPDGSLLCPAGQPLYRQELRSQPDGSLRVFYAARIGSCRPCPLRPRCQGPGFQSTKPRRVSAVLRPLPFPLPVPRRAPPQPSPCAILWGDWSRCQTRRRWMRLLRSQSVTLTCLPGEAGAQTSVMDPFTRAQRAHWRLSWAQRLARNACSPDGPSLILEVCGIPTALALCLGLATS